MTFGRRPTASDLRWLAAAEDLAPHKSLARMAANARSVVGTIAVIATLLAGLGTFAASQLTDEPGLMIGAALSVAAATVAVVLSLSALVSREKPLTPGNLDAVKEWYQERLKKGTTAAWGGVALIVSVVFAGGTSVAGLSIGALDRDTEAQMSLTVAEERDGATVHVEAELENVPENATVSVTLVDAKAEQLFRATLRPNDLGVASVKQDIELAKASEDLTLTANVLKGAKELDDFSLTEK